MRRSGGLLVLEIEPDLRDPTSAPLFHRATRAAVTHLAATGRCWTWPRRWRPRSATSPGTTA